MSSDEVAVERSRTRSELMIASNDMERVAEPSALFDASAEVRARAARATGRSRADAFHLRAVLLFDAAVAPRVAAAEALGSFADPTVGSMLADGLRDPSPLVRDAVARAIAKNGAVDHTSDLVEIARDDEAWYVRRTAVFAFAALAGFDAVRPLLRCLEDPFWRVRYAAALALESLGYASDEAREAVLSHEPETPAAHRALIFLRARWSGEAPQLDIARDHERPSNDPWYDDDPAVTTARVAAQTPPAERLVSLLGEPHEPLRKLAIRALARSRDRVALSAAACWLDVARVPHAAESARSVLRLAREDSLAIAVAAVDARLPEVAAWAIRALTDRHQTQLAHTIIARAEDHAPAVRAAVAYALPSMASSGEAASRALATLARDPSSSVRAAALASLLLIDHPEAERALAAMDPRAQTVNVRVALVRHAQRREDVAALRRALTDTHPYVRGAALDALRSLGALADRERQAFLRDEDPWIRGAVIEALDALDVLEHEHDVIVRRIAVDRVVADKRALDPSFVDAVGLRASTDRDPWLRSRAARLLVPSRGEASLVAMLALASDASNMVRAAATDALERTANIGTLAFDALRRKRVPPRAWGVALGWVARASDHGTVSLMALAEDPALRELIASISLTLPDAERARVQLVSGPPSITNEAPRTGGAHAPFPTESHRPFGRSSLRVSPIAFSGAQNPSESVFIQGRERGINAFFWEPRYHSLTRFIRRAPKKHDLHVITGTYHADAASIIADVDRALRRLGLERLGSFLLFWARSSTRLDDQAFDTLERLQRAGKIATHGFSTHLRDVATRALDEHPWDVVMTRYNAAHTGAERALWPAVERAGAAGIAFTALCYGRLLAPVPGSHTTPPTAADCYRFALANPAVDLVLAAPALSTDARAAFEAIERPALDPAAESALRAHGAAVYRVDTEFNALVRKGDRIVLQSPRDAAIALMDATRSDG